MQCSSGATDCHPGRRVSSFHPTFPKPKKELDVASHFFSSPSIAHAWRFLLCFLCSLLDDVQCLAGDGCRHLTGGFQILRGPHPPSEKELAQAQCTTNLQSKPVHAPEGGVNRQEVGSVYHQRSQRKQPENVLKGSRLHWELWQRLGQSTAPKSRCQGQAFSSGASARPTDQHTESGEGQEAIDSARCIPPAACCRCPGERSSSRTLPCPSLPLPSLCLDLACLQSPGSKFSASSKW